MKVETNYDMYGWKLSVTKSKEAITIRQRSKGRCHMAHKPMTLRLRPSEIKDLKRLLREIK